MPTARKDPKNSSQPPVQDDNGIYEIKIQGLLGDHWQKWFEGMTMKRQEDAEAGQKYTLLVGPVADQPALHGLLAKIRDLNLTLISVRKAGVLDSCGQAEDQNTAKKDQGWT